MGRKSKDKELTKKNFVGIKLSDQELENLQNGSDRLGISQSEYIRKLLSETPLELKYEIVYDSEMLKKIVHELGKIGINLNQIAYYFNTGGSRSLAMEDAIHEAISQIFKMRKEVLELKSDFSDNPQINK